MTENLRATAEREAAGFVYVVQHGETGSVKIGCARDVPLRLGNVQVGCPEPLTVICVLTGGRLHERRVHKALAQYRQRGEWFYPEALPHLFADAELYRPVPPEVWLRPATRRRRNIPYLRANESGYYWEPSRKLRALGFAAAPLGRVMEEAVAAAISRNEEIERLYPHIRMKDMGDVQGRTLGPRTKRRKESARVEVIEVSPTPTIPARQPPWR